jgi:TPR repeat protein
VALSLRYVHVAGNKFSHRGYMSSRHNSPYGTHHPLWLALWLSAAVLLIVPPGPAPAGEDQTVRDCDTLAAHANDPEKAAVKGVADEAIDTAKAIEACGAAVKANPQSGRLLFQLGRAYWTAERYEEAIETFLEAGELGHGGALAYLGDAILYGVGDLDPDPETAKSLYQRAADAGFTPAAALAAEIVAGAEPVRDQAQQQAGEPDYHYPKLVQKLAEGQVYFDTGLSREEYFVYMASLTAGIRHHCPKILPAEPIFFLKVLAAMGKRFGAGAATLDQKLAEGVYQEINQAGIDDGYAFVYVKGCQSQETQKFVRTITGYFN